MAVSVVTSRRLEWLTTQRDQTLGELNDICDRAASEDRDLTDAEQASVEDRRNRIERWQADLKVEAEFARGAAESQAIASELGPFTRSADRDQAPGVPPAAPAELYRSPGQYLYDFMASATHSDERARARFGEYLRANQVLADNPGIVPTPILGPVWTGISNRRPAIEAATARPLPGGGKTFQRPVVTTHTVVDTQATEKTALASRAMKIDPLTVTKITKGGQVNLSFQDRDWTDPAILDILVADLAASYAQDTDDEFCDILIAGVTQTVTVASNDAAGWMAAIYEAAAMVAAPDNRMTNTMWVSVDVWSMIGSLVDGAGRPLFPALAPGNAMGTMAPTNMFGGSIAGLRLAVDGHFPAGTAIIGDSLAAEFYETVGGQLQAIEPSLLGTTVAFYGYMAGLVVAPAALVKLVAPALPLASSSSSKSK